MQRARNPISFQPQHFEWLATELAKAKPEGQDYTTEQDLIAATRSWRITTKQISDSLMRTNAKFDEYRFLTACEWTK